MDPMFGVHWRLMVTSSPCSNGIFTKERVLSLQNSENCHNWRQCANHPGKKIIARCHLEFSYFFICTATGSYYSPLHGARQFYHKYSIWTRGGCHQNVPNETQTLHEIGKHPLITFTSPCAGILKTSNAQGFYSSNAQELHPRIIFFTLMRRNS